MSHRRFDGLAVEVHATAAAAGAAAAAAVADCLAGLARRHGRLRMVFAAAPSQEEFLAALTLMPGVPWPRITAFHLDEYLGLPPDAPQRFVNWLQPRLLRRVPFAAVHTLDGGADPAAEAQRYAALLRAQPLHVACLGIGENGHLAFNDPPDADFADPALVRVATLEQRCRQQQVHDGCFASLADVPLRALTLTIPAIMGARHIFAVVPSAAKAPAVRDALLGPIAASCPASILRRHRSARLYLDAAAAALLPGDGPAPT